MKRILHAVEAWMDDFKIKNKFYILYILCVLVPLIVDGQCGIFCCHEV